MNIFDEITSGASARRVSARELVRASGVIGAGPCSGVGEQLALNVTEYIGFGGLFVVSPIMVENVVQSVTREIWQSYAFNWVLAFFRIMAFKERKLSRAAALVNAKFQFWVILNFQKEIVVVAKGHINCVQELNSRPSFLRITFRILNRF